MVLQLTAVIAKRNAALFEKSIIIVEKMAAWAERDAALADRDSALLKRDAAISTLTKVEKESSSCAQKRPSVVGDIHGSKLLQRIGFAKHYSLVGEFQPNYVMTFDAQCTWVASEHLAFQGTRTQTELWRKQSPQVSPGVPTQNKALHLAVKKVAFTHLEAIARISSEG
ncbi:unnamed protein product [Sphagnum tenellum]